MSEDNESGAVAEVVATHTISGGIADLNTTLTFRSDGSLHFSGRRFSRDEKRALGQKRIRSLQSMLSKPDWQEVELFYGQPVPDGFNTQSKAKRGHRHYSPSAERAHPGRSCTRNEVI